MIGLSYFGMKFENENRLFMSTEECYTDVILLYGAVPTHIDKI